MRVLLTSFVCLAATPLLVFATDVPSITKNRTDVSTKLVGDESDNERMMRFPLDPSSKEMRELQAKKAAGKDVFEEFQVGNDAFNTLTNHKLPTLMHLYSESPEETMKLSKLFTERYGDGQMALLLMDNRYFSEEQKETIATTLLKGQLEGYLRDKLSPFDVFRVLGIPTDQQVFVDARLEVLKKYLTLYNSEKSTVLSLIEVLSPVMGGEENLVKSITVAKTHAFSKENALDVEKLLIAKWKGETNLNPDFLLGRLGIKKSFLEYLKDSEFGLDWLQALEPVTKYITHYNLKNMNNQFSLSKWFAEIVGEDVLTLVLFKAIKTKETKEIATALQQEQLNRWLASKKSVGDVFALLKLKYEGPNMFESPKMKVLNMYMEKYNVQRARLRKDPATMIEVLLDAFGDSNLGLLLLNALETGSKENLERLYEVRRHLESLFSRWYEADIKPSRFKKELYYEEDKSISDQVETLFKMYTEFYEKRTPTEGK